MKLPIPLGPARHGVPDEPGCEAVCYRACVSWILPVSLLLFVSVVALSPGASLARRPTSAPRLLVEAFVTALAVIALVWLAWVARWLVAQRW